MAIKRWVLFLLIIAIKMKLYRCKECVIDNRSRDLSWEVQLNKDVMKKCRDIIYYSPSNDSRPVQVNVRFVLQYISFQKNEEVFSVQSSIFLTWEDYRLKWNPADYGGIDRMAVYSVQIWNAAIKLQNSLDEKQWELYYSACTVKYTGKVQCVPRVTLETVCSTKLRNWPFDTQSCTLHFGEWPKPYSKVTFKFKAMDMLTAAYGNGWTIVDYAALENPNKTEQISLTFYLERDAYGIAVSIVIPSIILSILTMVSLVLSVDGIRFSISCLCLTLHFYILTYISDALPKHSADIPLILLFVRTSAIMTFFIVILTFVLQYLKSLERPVYAWVNSFNYYVFDSKLHYLIWPKWKMEQNAVTVSDTLQTNRNNKEEWLLLANSLNSIIFILYMLLYTIFVFVFVPKFTPFNHLRLKLNLLFLTRQNIIKSIEKLVDANVH